MVNVVHTCIRPDCSNTYQSDDVDAGMTMGVLVEGQMRLHPDLLLFDAEELESKEISIKTHGGVFLGMRRIDDDFAQARPTHVLALDPWTMLG